MDIHLRESMAADVPRLQQLFYDTVQQVNRRDYSAQQIQIWSSFAWDDQGWRDRLSNQHVIVAAIAHQIVGFASLEPEGHVDLFFVHAQHQGQGVGARLLAHLEAQAQQTQLPRLYTEASITARPFFERNGFKVTEEEFVKLQGVTFQRYRMEKKLAL
jgi:putative acetyltransferase